MAAGELVDDLEAGVVTGARVLDARIAEPDDQLERLTCHVVDSRPKRRRPPGEPSLPRAAGVRSCPVRRLLLAALLLPGSGLFLRRCRVLLLLALLRLAGGGWSARSRRGCGTRSARRARRARRARGERGCALGGHGGSGLGGHRLWLLGARRM